MRNANPKRLFLAVPLDSLLIKSCLDFTGNQNHLPKVRWISPENWHITTVFLGDYPSSLIPELESNLESFFFSIEPFSISFDHFTYKPDQIRPTMIWGKFYPNDLFDAFIRQTHEFLKIHYQQLSLDFKISIRIKNTPHITLARLKETNIKWPVFHQTNHLKDYTIKINHCQLFESVLLPKGAEYYMVHDFSMGRP